MAKLMSLLEISREYNIPKTTLADRAKGMNIHRSGMKLLLNETQVEEIINITNPRRIHSAKEIIYVTRTNYIIPSMLNYVDEDKLPDWYDELN